MARAAGVPYIGPFTGAEFLRDAAMLSNVINMRASYYQETEEMVARLTTDLGVERIAVLYQDDSYGLAGFNGVRLALERRGMEMAALGIYTRNTTAVKTALLDLRQGNPEAVIIIGAYQPVAAMIAWGRQVGFDGHLHDRLIRRQQRPRRRAWLARRGGIRHPSRALPHR